MKDSSIQEIKERVSANSFARVRFRRSSYFSLLLVLISFAFSQGCGNNQTELRRLAPAETIIYFESRDVGKMLDIATDNKAFAKAGGSADFSAVMGMRMAVIVTGLQRTEESIGEGGAVLSLTPKFVAAIDTNAWSWQVRALIENSLDRFVRRTYGKEAKREIVEENGVDWFRWSASDGREVWALAEGELILFGNDKEHIQTALEGWKSGGTENKVLELEAADIGDSIAYGIVLENGMTKISDVVGVATAVEQSQDVSTRSVISQVVPELMRNLLRQGNWCMQKSETGVRDEIRIKIDPESATILDETLESNEQNFDHLYNFVPRRFSSLTRYSLENALIAYRSIILVVAQKANSANVLAQFSNKFLVSYGITDAEMFFRAVEPRIITGVADKNGEDTFVIAEVIDRELLEKSISRDFVRDEKTDSWQTEGGLFAKSIGKIFIIGEKNAVMKILEDQRNESISPSEPENDQKKTKPFSVFKEAQGAAVTLEYDFQTAESVAHIFSNSSSTKQVTTYDVKQTSVSQDGIYRVYESEFGVIGGIVSRF